MDCQHNYLFEKDYFKCTKCGHKRYQKSQSENKKKIGSTIVILATVIIIGILFANGVLEINQDNLDETLQNLPEPIQEASKSAQLLATETTIVLRDTINARVGPVELKPVQRLVADIKQIPKVVKEKNPLNEKPEINKKELEIQIHDLTNQYRIQNNLEPLLWDEELSNVARGHSKDMAWRNYFDHQTPEGLSPTDRGKLLDYQCEKLVGDLIYSGIGENIFQNNLYNTVWYVAGIPTSYEWNSQNEIVKSTVDGWMDSPGHRENILTDSFDREGIGIEIAEDDKVYITQNFC